MGLRGSHRIMEKKIRTTVVYGGMYWDYLGIMEKKMETTIWGLGCRAYIEGSRGKSQLLGS